MMIKTTVFKNIISGGAESSNLKRKKRNDWRTILPSLLFPAALILLFILLIALSIPEGCIFGSHTDWLSQHAALERLSGTPAWSRRRCSRPGWIWAAEQMDFSSPIMDFSGRIS